MTPYHNLLHYVAELAGGKGEVKMTRKVKRVAARAKERAGT